MRSLHRGRSLSYTDSLNLPTDAVSNISTLPISLDSAGSFASDDAGGRLGCLGGRVVSAEGRSSEDLIASSFEPFAPFLRRELSSHAAEDLAGVGRV